MKTFIGEILKEKAGSKETVEVLDFVFDLAKSVRREMKGDGFQKKDIAKFLLSSEGRQSLTDALLGITEVPGEIRHFALATGFDIAQYAVKRAIEIVEDTAASAKAWQILEAQ